MGIDTPLPQELSSDRGVLYVSGWCFDERDRVDRLELLVNSRPQPVVAWRMPRAQVAEQFSDDGVERKVAYRSGFWGFVELQPEDAWEVSLRAWVRGDPYEHPLGTVRPGAATQPRSTSIRSGDGRPLIAVCMATYNPSRSAFAGQIESIRAQTYDNWICVINDDHSAEDAFAGIRQVIGGDERFVIHRNAHRLGFYRNFEAVLRGVPANVDYVALSDQDDRWYPHKLETLLRLVRQPGTVLAYSDMRIVDSDGRVLRDTFWNLGRRNNFTDLAALLSANSVTGAASLFERQVLDVALPFPRIRGQYHDHWLACVALAMGNVVYTEERLHDYIQHEHNVLGHRARPGPENSGSRAVQQWYFVNVIGSMMYSRELAIRLRALSDDKRVALHRMAGVDGASGAMTLLTRAIEHPLETRTVQLLAGLSWRWLMARTPGAAWRKLSVTKSAYPDPEASPNGPV